jgi:hypothetical protein
LAQQKPTLARASEKTGLRLTVTAGQTGHHVGDSINIAVKFRNVSDGPVLVVGITYHGLMSKLSLVDSPTPFA